ncbi:MAG: hypothetical protein ABI467_11945 [Kofleriaceae bacterium]
MREECSAGFPRSCVALGSLEPPEPDRKLLWDRTRLLAVAGCDAWILDECSFASDDPAKQIVYEKRACKLTASCNRVGTWAQDAGKLLAARDAYERACQYDEHDAHRCLGLADSYLDHEYPEPVLGRGQALLDWVCRKFEKTLDKGESIVDMLKSCKRMTPHLAR